MMVVWVKGLVSCLGNSLLRDYRCASYRRVAGNGKIAFCLFFHWMGYYSSVISRPQRARQVRDLPPVTD
jgi:hypothetical protein